MRKAPERAQALIQRTVTAMGYELVGVEWVRSGAVSGVLRVYLDRAGGITLDDCSAVSHQLSGVLDVEDPIAEHYTLEISSPGLDRPLFEPSHFERFKGGKARLRLVVPWQGRRKLEGVLAGMEGDMVLIDVAEVRCRIPFEQVESARLAPDFIREP